MTLEDIVEKEGKKIYICIILDNLYFQIMLIALKCSSGGWKKK